MLPCLVFALSVRGAKCLKFDFLCDVRKGVVWNVVVVLFSSGFG